MKNLELNKKGILKERRKQLFKELENCKICPRQCGINRVRDVKGYCRTGRFALVSSYNLHFGEEPPISGSSGSGTIFFTNCNTHCKFCQNYPISQLGHGHEVDAIGLADIMLELQSKGAHNINFVTPTHVVPQIVEALCIAIEKGLDIPLVYNSGGYDSSEILKLLEGVIDIYMPDAKYGSDEFAKKYSDASDYPNINRDALKEMHNQVGDLNLNSSGIAVRGLLIRHLVLPHNIAASDKVLSFIAKEISNKTYMSIMAQYHPAYRAHEYPELSRRPLLEEYQKVLDWADLLGLRRGWRQDF